MTNQHVAWLLGLEYREGKDQDAKFAEYSMEVPRKLLNF